MNAPLGKKMVHPANCCRKHIQEIVSKSGLKASCPGSRRRAEAGPVEGLNQCGMRGGSVCGPTLCQGLSPQMRNAFNILRRDSFLSVARVRTPGLYNLLWHAYSSPSRLFFGEEGFASEIGIQQGDPIGPALFALSVDEAAQGVQSEFNVWYLDDATLGDSVERVHDDLLVLLERLRVIGLEVNGSKCELTILNDSMLEATEALFRGLLPGVRVVEACDISLLGPPVDIQGIPGTIHKKMEALERMTSNLEVLNPHQAFVLLKNGFAIPKLQYVL